MEIPEALDLLYRGQTNVAVTAKALDMPLETLQEKFRHYVKSTPVDPDIWEGDILITWPYIT